MFFRQFVLASLGHASYLVGDPAGGEAVLVDPRRDVGGTWRPPGRVGCGSPMWWTPTGTTTT